MIIPSLDWSSIIWRVVTIYLTWGGLAFLYVLGKGVVKVARKSHRTPATVFDQVRERKLLDARYAHFGAVPRVGEPDFFI
jgi:hypothetical protein